MVYIRQATERKELSLGSREGKLQTFAQARIHTRTFWPGPV